MAKAAIYAAEAERLFVNEGMSPDTIVGILQNKVSHRTIYDWIEKGNWKKKREQYANFKIDISEGVRDVIQKSLTQALANPERKNIVTLREAIKLASMLEKPLLDFIKDNPDVENADANNEQKKADLKNLFKEVLGIDVNF